MDWNSDGKPDILFCRSSEAILWLNTGEGDTPEFTVKGNLLEGSSIPYAHPYALDWNGDGDTDLLVASSYLLLYLFERSYLDDGSAPGTVLMMEKRSSQTKEKPSNNH